MAHLTIASLIWAISFGLIGTYLQGIPSVVVAAIRLGASALLFLPFLRLAKLPSGFVEIRVDLTSNDHRLLSVGRVPVQAVISTYVR